MADDFMGSIYKGVLAREAGDRMESRNRMAPFIEPALRGDQGALASVFQASPETGARIAQVVTQMDANKRRSLAEYTDFITRDGMGILQAPAADRPGLYAQTIEAARARGYDVSSLPPTYGPDAEVRLKAFVGRAMPFARYFKTQGGGGAPAPAGGGGGVWRPYGGAPGAGPSVSDAAPPGSGPMVADAQPPMTQPPQTTIAPGGTGGASLPGGAPQPQMASAAPPPNRPTPPTTGGGPIVDDMPDWGGAIAQTRLPGPPQIAAPATAAPPDVQVASAPTLVEGGGTSDDAGEGGGTTIQGADGRVWRVPRGYVPSFPDPKKGGQPHEEGGGIWLTPVDQQGRPTGQPEKHLIPPRTPPRDRNPPAGYEPRPGQPDALRPIEGGPATDKLRQFDASARDVFNSADRFLQVFTDQGGAGINTFLNNPRDPKAQLLLTAYNNMIMSLRGEGFANTGVLQPAEIKMLQDQMLSPETIRGAMASPEAMRAKIDELKRYVQAKRDAHFGAAGVPLPQGGPTAPPAAPSGASAAPGGQPRRLKYNPATGELE